MIFKDRREAGERLAKRLAGRRGGKSVVVLGLPRGGVVVAAEVARRLRVPLDVVVAKKIGAPGNPELALGAVSGEAVVVDEAAVRACEVSDAYLQEEARRVKKEVARREALFRHGRPRLALAGKTAMVVDDGVATGATMRAAVQNVRRQGAERIIVAAPVSSPEAAEALAREADEFVSLEIPPDFAAVGQFYAYFPQTEDEEVIAAIRELGGFSLPNSRAAA